MDKIINRVLIFISFLMLLMSGVDTFFVVGAGVMAYGLNLFLPQFILLYSLVFISLAFFIFSLSLRKRVIKQNKKIGYILIFLSISCFLFMPYVFLTNGGFLSYIFFVLFSLYLFLVAYKMIKKN